MKIRITDRNHPHYGETGTLTGEAITLFGKTKLEVALDEGGECFIGKAQANAFAPRPPKPPCRK